MHKSENPHFHSLNPYMPISASWCRLPTCVRCLYTSLYLDIPVSCITRGVVPIELQCSVTTLLLSTHYKPVLMFIHRRKRATVRKSILSFQEIIQFSAPIQHLQWYKRTSKPMPLLEFTHPITTSDCGICPLGDSPKPTHPVVLTRTANLMFSASLLNVQYSV